MPKSKARKGQKKKVAHQRRKSKQQAFSQKVKQEKIYDDLRAKYEAEYTQSIKDELELRKNARETENSTDAVKELAENEPILVKEEGSFANAVIENRS